MFPLAVFYALFVLACLAASLLIGMAIWLRLVGALLRLAITAALFVFHQVSSGRLKRPLPPSAQAADGPFFMPEEGCTTLYQKVGRGGTRHD